MTCRRFTVEAPAGAMGVGDPVAAERLALLRCQPWLLAVPVRAQQLSLASFCLLLSCRAASSGSGLGWDRGEGGGVCGAGGACRSVLVELPSRAAAGCARAKGMVVCVRRLASEMGGAVAGAVLPSWLSQRC